MSVRDKLLSNDVDYRTCLVYIFILLENKNTAE